MGSFLGRSLVRLAAVFILVLVVDPVTAASGTPAIAGDTAILSGRGCVGSNDTLSWIPPFSGVRGYRVVTRNIVFPQNPGATYDLPPDQTSLDFPVQFGILDLTLYALTQSGYVKVSAVDDTGRQKPQPMQWDSYSDGQNQVGDGFVTVAFLYPSESVYFDSGNSNNVMVTVTASLGGTSVTSKATFSQPMGGSLGVADTFTGLTNGLPYTFVSVASNECGASEPSLRSDFLTPTAPTPATTTTTSAAATTTTAPMATTTTTAAATTTTGATTTTTTPSTSTCFVLATRPPAGSSPAQQLVQVQATTGLAAVTNIEIANGTVTVAPFTPGTKDPVVVTATKTTPGVPTRWSFDMTDLDGQAKHCA